jgi:hypothetical protein
LSLYYCITVLRTPFRPLRYTIEFIMPKLLIATIVALILLSASMQEAVYLPTIILGPTAIPTSTLIPGQQATNTPTFTTVPGQQGTNTPTSTAIPGQQATATSTNTPTTQVGNQTATSTATPTQTSTPAVPSPYNVQAKDIVLQTSDIPEGSQMDDSEALTLTDEAIAWGGVNGHVTHLSNQAEHLLMESKVLVFETKVGASQAIAYAVDVFEQDPSYTRVSIPTYGDESAAFVSTRTMKGQLVETYYMTSYLGNVWTGLLIEGPAEKIDVEDATSYTQRMLEKLQ